MIEVIRDSLNYCYDQLAYTVSSVGSLSDRVFSAAYKPFEYLGSFFYQKPQRTSTLTEKVTETTARNDAFASWLSDFVSQYSLQLPSYIESTPYNVPKEATFKIEGIYEEYIDGSWNNMTLQFVSCSLQLHEKKWHVLMAAWFRGTGVFDDLVFDHLALDCISNRPLPSPQLFYDVLLHIIYISDTLGIRKFVTGDDSPIYLHSEDVLDQNIKKQVWIFNHPEKIISIPVTLETDRQGETDVIIHTNQMTIEDKIVV